MFHRFICFKIVCCFGGSIRPTRRWAGRPHQRLAGKQIFSKLYLRSAYWQFPMHKSYIEKIALSPGPGYGLWEFVVMPYGLTGATQTCQRGLDEIFRECHDFCRQLCWWYNCLFRWHKLPLVRSKMGVLEKLKSAGFTLSVSWGRLPSHTWGYTTPLKELCLPQTKLSLQLNGQHLNLLRNLDPG